jgi:hypothetical protein
MTISLKNTLISLTLSGLLVFAGCLSGEKPASPSAAGFSSAGAQTALQSQADTDKNQAAKKAKRLFKTPYFSFGKSRLSTGAR